ncbi:hypothetical protein KOM00_02125 [Geomonas sp. Red69]|uniref:Uncharacterized protein n=1 Tax=Geomonas diazotrophica TaxID=2843197 RepID=A0ABX8JPS9_9BACT|nr:MULTISPECIES: hypothetical protein [Geomonas]MBU5635524.1 hypothetical protein [Geomonas diazotrophica]QWV97425.1 hypothetical protein KP005_19120 [Geomonas nitrogeniifigens]QXE86583.1 hypothetical protein KP003_19860 [Geomonas nitrogeniifigens]
MVKGASAKLQGLVVFEPLCLTKSGPRFFKAGLTLEKAGLLLFKVTPILENERLVSLKGGGMRGRGVGLA